MKTQNTNSVLSVVKIGGNVIGDQGALEAFLADFSRLQGPKILVHGGGKKASELSEKLGIPPKMVEGRRITDADTLEVITMVYGGLVNKNIVAALQSFDCNAMGLSGADAGSILAHQRPVVNIDYGYAGDIERVNHKVISSLLALNITPVFCAISHNGKGQLLNTNADTIAAEIAIAMSKIFDTSLYYCFEKDGVLRDKEKPDSVIKHINRDLYSQLVADGTLSEGMLPKMKNCFHALEQGVARVCIGNSKMIKATDTSHTLLTLK